MHTLVCRVFKWNYEQLLYGQTFLPTDIRFARANVPLIKSINDIYFSEMCLSFIFAEFGLGLTTFEYTPHILKYSRSGHTFTLKFPA